METAERPGTMLDLNPYEAERLFAELVRARNGVRNAIRANNIADIGFFFGWLDASLTKVADSCPQSVKRIAREEYSARLGGAPATVGGHGGIAGPLGGGGNKPD